MTPELMKYICEPITKAPLVLIKPSMDEEGNIQSGELVSPSGRRYPIVDGIPRFVDYNMYKTVKSFGDEWNYFNFTDFKINWLTHTVANTFGTTDVFKNKLIVDAGAGSGAQSKWFVEYGAKHVIVLELSHSVDHIIKNNLQGLKNVDIIQCAIDAPPLRDESIDGIVYCHNVIQHTQSVEKTAEALYAIVAPGGEFVFNCYRLNDEGLIRWIRFYFIYKTLRALLSKMPFSVRLFYARLMGLLRLVPFLGLLLEKSGFCVTGNVPKIENETYISYLKRHFKNTCLNIFDFFGAHHYQHFKSDDEIRNLVSKLQPDPAKVLNMEKYFMKPQPIGCALRVFK